jgi:proteic killer suppression protein
LPAFRPAAELHISIRQCKVRIDICTAAAYTVAMIRSFRSKPLRLFAETGDASKLPIENVARLERILARLNASVLPEDMNIPGFRFHGLKAKPKRYAVDASANYRITFGWEGEDAIGVDLEDYH